MADSFRFRSTLFGSLHYHYQREGWAKKALSNWCDLAEASGLKAFEKLAKGFRKASDRITSYVRHKLTSGKIEGFNSKLSRCVQRACGINNLDYLFLKVRHESVMQI